MVNFLIREAHEQDLEDINLLAEEASLGVTNLPKSKEVLRKKLNESKKSFTKQVTLPHNERYIFSCIDIDTNKVIGVSQLKVHHPPKYPLPYFLVSEERQRRSTYPHHKAVKLLQLTFEVSPATELCGLFLDQKIRHEGIGKPLSLVRFLFMARHPKRFTHKVFADMRGTILDNGTAPLWDAIGRLFCPVTFAELYELYIKQPQDFWKVLPTHPIYTSMIEEQARACIGTPHPRTKPAMNMLAQEGFFLTNLVHPMDGGPRLSAYFHQIQSIKYSQSAKISTTYSLKDGKKALISPTTPPFCAVVSSLQFDRKGELIISKNTSNQLGLTPGDTCHYLMLN